MHKAQQAETEKCAFRDEVSPLSTVLNIKQCFNACYTRLVAGSKLAQIFLNMFLIHGNPSSSKVILTGLAPKSRIRGQI